ncbi:hypothetical protein [Streptomyces sp. NRRL S-448]
MREPAGSWTVRYAPRLIGRPPVIAVRDGSARMLVRRESLDDISRRDIGL